MIDCFIIRHGVVNGSVRAGGIPCLPLEALKRNRGIPIGGQDGTRAGGKTKLQGPILIARPRKIPKESISEMGRILSDPNAGDLRDILIYICFAFAFRWSTWGCEV
jgi:hypothetical protein